MTKPNQGSILRDETGWASRVFCTAVILVMFVSDPAHGLDRSTTAPGVAVCHTILNRYRALASAHPGDDPLTVLANSSTASFRRIVSGRYLGISGNPVDDLVAWSKGQRPRVTISRQLSESLNVGPTVLQKAPGLPFFTLSGSDGRCDMSVFFLIRDAVAVPAPKPFRDDDDDCAESGEFASLDSTPLYVRDNFDYWHEMTTLVEVAVWHVDHFQRACSISLSYSPQTIAESDDPSGATCNRVSCEEMRKAALTLASENNDGSLSEETLLSRLCPDQRKIYRSEKTNIQSSAEDSEGSDNAAFVPYYFQGNVFVVRIANQISRGISTSDQIVSFKRVKLGRVVQDAAFAVYTRKGELREATVFSAY
jgi:hypothetical protein